MYKVIRKNRWESYDSKKEFIANLSPVDLDNDIYSDIFFSDTITGESGYLTFDDINEMYLSINPVTPDDVLLKEKSYNTIDNMDRDFRASWWAITNGTEKQLMGGGTWEKRFGGDDGNLGGIQTKKRKIDILSKTSYATSFKPSNTELQIVKRLLEVRGNDDFYYVGSE